MTFKKVDVEAYERQLREAQQKQWDSLTDEQRAMPFYRASRNFDEVLVQFSIAVMKNYNDGIEGDASANAAGALIGHMQSSVVSSLMEQGDAPMAMLFMDAIRDQYYADQRERAVRGHDIAPVFTDGTAFHPDAKEN